MDVKVNFSIPVHLFDYRESENSLYSYAKLKIFYIGQTGDKRLFTKEFSDQLIESLPYVPVVGFYDEEEEDFKGHHQEIQHIYGIVPEDTNVEYIEEDGKKYAVCDVILYTGRHDKTGQIAQKIVGKQHSLELNPNNTTYQINRDSQGKVKNIEFKTGSLLGLSILGDNEKPAFSGSGFFTENTELMQLFENFRKELKKFTKQNQHRGENMNVDAENVVTTVENEPVQDTAQFSSEDSSTNTELQSDDTLDNVEQTTETTEGETTVVQEEFNETLTREQRLADFMRVTYDEVAQAVLSQFYKAFGDYVYVMQWSPFDNVIVYVDFNDGNYFRVPYTMSEETEEITFGEKVSVKPRFLTDEEIETIFTEQEQVTDKEEFNKGTEGLQTDSSTQTNSEDDTHEEFQEADKSKQEGQEELSSTALNNSEREELEAFRREKKQILIESFSDDLSLDFLKELKAKIDEFTYDQLDVVLSKEFTKVSRQDKKITKTNSFVLTVEGNGAPRSEKEIVAALVEQYKTRK